jgi:hypothetical protein
MERTIRLEFTPHTAPLIAALLAGFVREGVTFTAQQTGMEFITITLTGGF